MVAIIPAEPEDNLGHADGQVAWLDDDVIGVMNYPIMGNAVK